MEKLIINTARTPNGFSCSCDLLPNWIVAKTGTLEEFKQYVQESIAFFVKCAKKDNEPYPLFLDEEYEIVYQFDVRSLLSYYSSIFSFSAMESVMGINQRQLWHYANGVSVPRKNQRNKINKGIKRLATELMSVCV